MITVEMIVIGLGGALMALTTWGLKKVVERIEGDIKDIKSDLTEVKSEIKNNTIEFNAFSIRTETILEYHEKRFDECDAAITNKMERYREF